MSSHHIIREKQEPALLILDIHNFNLEYLGQLLEWSPTVLAGKNVVDHVHSLGIKIDVIVGELDEAEPLQEHTKSICCANHLILSSSLDFLIEEGYPALNIIVDNPDLSSLVEYTSKIDLVLLNNQYRTFSVKSGFSKWKTAGEDIRVACTTEEPDVHGLEKVSDLRYKTVKDGFYSLKFNQEYIFISEEL